MPFYSISQWCFDRYVDFNLNLSTSSALRFGDNSLREENDKLRRQLEAALKENKTLTQKLSSPKLPLVSQIESSDKTFNHNTGFTTNERLLIVFEFLNAGSNGENVTLYDNEDSSNLKGGRTRAPAPYESFLMAVIRLRRNFSTQPFSFFVSSSWIWEIWYLVFQLPIFYTCRRNDRSIMEFLGLQDFPLVKTPSCPIIERSYPIAIKNVSWYLWL